MVRGISSILGYLAFRIMELWLTIMSGVWFGTQLHIGPRTVATGWVFR